MKNNGPVLLPLTSTGTCTSSVLEYHRHVCIICSVKIRAGKFLLLNLSITLSNLKKRWGHLFNCSVVCDEFALDFQLEFVISTWGLLCRIVDFLLLFLTLIMMVALMYKRYEVYIT